MRTPALIAIVAAAAIAVAWLLLAGSRQPPAAATPAAVAPAPPAASDEREAAAVRAQTAIPPPEPAPITTKPAPAPAVVEPSPKPAESAAADAATDDESAASNNDEASDEAEPTDDDADSSSIDVGHAADLLADWMAKQDVAASDDDASQVNTKALKTFDQEEADPDWSAKTAQQIEATLDQWLDALPDDVRDHLDLIHVECRQTMCQILAAENEIPAADGQATQAQLWLQGLKTLEGQPLWNELGFTGMSTAASRDEASGYFLFQTYMSRAATPAG